MNARRLVTTWAFPIAIAAAGVVDANVMYTVSLNTATMSGAGYALAFSFQDGSGLFVPDNNNTVTLSNFAFGVGSASGAPVTSGGASGNLGSSVILSDSDFSNSLVQGFTPGTSLSFNIDLTTNVDASGVPDFFGFAILILSSDTSLPTQDDTGGDNLLYFNIDSADPMPAPWATVVGTQPALDAPTVGPTQPPEPPGQVPEPGSLWLLSAGLAGLLGIRRRGLSRR